MRVVIVLMVLCILMMLLGAITVKSEERVARPVSTEEWTEDAKVWTGRSCVGEAGFEAVEECMAIAWVYATRSKESGKPFIWIVRRYSGTVKKHRDHVRPWIFNLGVTGDKPEGWPRNVRWGPRSRLWKILLENLEDWAEGKVANPVPGANHYGSVEESKRVIRRFRWARLDTPKYFRNWFFDSRGRL